MFPSRDRMIAHRGNRHESRRGRARKSQTACRTRVVAAAGCLSQKGRSVWTWRWGEDDKEACLAGLHGLAQPLSETRKVSQTWRQLCFRGMERRRKGVFISFANTDCSS
ncbi:unnamed protein product [Mycena citricolor]|uniref:Uncharacterized protein n=1 Tax=Mycena citricolor TaxID=2018698 RepID=A0AAD2JWT1_9AGAR|nr:unnamed protein product [Mycena citricolor]